MLVLVPLGGHQVHKWSNFVRETWLIKEKWNKRSCLKPPMNADARRCSAPLIGVHRRFPNLGGMRSARYNLLELGDSLCLRVFVVDWVQVLPRRHAAAKDHEGFPAAEKAIGSLFAISSACSA